MTEDDKQRAKWYGLFFRKQTPGHFMLRLRMNAGHINAEQLRASPTSATSSAGLRRPDHAPADPAALVPLGDVPEIWRRLEAVGLHSLQTGMDNVRGVCGCPVAGLTPHELLDPTPVIDEYNAMLLGNREFTNLPRKFNVTITGCLENCCHVETQDIGLVPAYRELDGRQVNGFNVLVGGKQGSGGYTPARRWTCSCRPRRRRGCAARSRCLFRDHGTRGQRTRARLAFLIERRASRGCAPRWRGGSADAARGRHGHAKTHHVDHLGIHPQKRPVAERCTPSACWCRSAASPRRRCAAWPTWRRATATARCG